LLRLSSPAVIAIARMVNASGLVQGLQHTAPIP
jgi:hypothetical protein